MAAKGAQFLTMADVAKSKDKKIGAVAEVLKKTDQIIVDLPYTEMNMKTYHLETIRSGLPEVYYRKANQAIPSSKSTTEDRTFNGAHFESKSQIDKAVAMRGGVDRIAYNRWNQAKGHIQKHAQEHASLMFYGSPSDSTEKSPGLADVYSTLNTGVPTHKQVLDGGGTGSDNTSIFLLHLGEDAIFGAYPAGTQAGLKRTDHSAGGKLVQILATDVNGNPGTLWGYEEQFEVDHALIVKDYRQGARIANIDTVALRSGVGAADLLDLMIDAAYKIDDPSNGTGYWYVNRLIENILHKQALTKVGAGAGLTFDNFEGKPVLTFLGRRVRRADSLLNSESRVTT